MKLRNKKTGEIVTADLIYSNADNCVSSTYSLAELNAEWEDYKEPEDFWFIDNCIGIRVDSKDESLQDEKYDIETMKAIGNYFETKEEAKKVVEKLKAWKRLKDTGCKPIGWRWKQDYPNDACYVEVVLKCQFDSGVHDKELDLLFGGEE